MIRDIETVYLMENTVQKYGWGTADYIAELTGIVNAEKEPFAELWMGAHPKAPSIINSGQALNDFIAADTAGILGCDIAGQYGELPFLLKVLSAGKPLSIQVHPSREQAVLGFENEEVLKLPLDAKIRNYKDRNHKPEMLLALTPFYAMTGIRPMFEIGEIICFLRLDQKIEEFGSLTADLSSENVQSFFNWLLNLKGREKEKVRNNILRAAMLRRGCDFGAYLAIEWICRLDHYYPDDIGIFAPIMLNTIQMQPGEALFMEAGIMHAYLQGTGLEIMANSDNVLRCGLTPKNIDKAELMKVAKFESNAPQMIKPFVDGLEEVYQVPVE